MVQLSLFQIYLFHFRSSSSVEDFTEQSYVPKEGIVE